MAVPEGDPATSLKPKSGKSVYSCGKGCKKKSESDPTKYAKSPEEQHISVDLASLDKKPSVG